MTSDGPHPMTVAVVTLGLSSIVLNLFFLTAVQVLREKSTMSNSQMQNMSLADVLAALMFAPVRLREHQVRLAHSRSKAEEHLKASSALLTLLALDLFQQLIGCRPIVIYVCFTHNVFLRRPLATEPPGRTAPFPQLRH